MRALHLLLAASLLALVANADATPAHAPEKIAVFPFELDDFAAGATYGVRNGADVGQTQAATAAARTALAQSGRYLPVDTAGKAQESANAHPLRDCNGCEAAIALRAGAELSLLGVIRRISQTEYVVRFTVRDARTGALLASRDSGLRIGAAYSWDRGTAILLQTWLHSQR